MIAAGIFALYLAAPGAAAGAFSLPKDGGYSLMVVHNDCWAPYFTDLDWVFRPATLLTAGTQLRVCVEDSVTKTLGMGITGGAVLVNALQVRKLWLAGNAEGLSLIGQYSSALSNLLMTVWWVWFGNAPLTAYAECLIQAAGSLAVAALMWGFVPPSVPHRFAAVAALVAALALLPGKRAVEDATRLAPNALSLALYLASNVSFWWARVSQLHATWSAGGDDSQFIVALVANAVGSLMRVFTSSKEIRAPEEVKPWILYIMAFNFALNVALVAQWAYYGGKKGGRGAQKRRTAGGGAMQVNERPPPRSASVKAVVAIAEQAKSPGRAASAARAQARSPAKAPAARKRPQRA